MPLRRPRSTNRREQVGEQVGEPLFDVEDAGRVDRLKADRSGEGERREKLGAACGRHVVGSVHAQRRRLETGTLAKRIHRDAHWHRLRQGARRRGSFREQLRHPLAIAAQEDGQPALCLRQPTPQLRQAGLRVPQILAHPIQIERVGQSSLVADGGELLAFLEHVHGSPCEGDPTPEVHDLEVRGNRLGQHADAHRAGIRVGSEQFGAGRQRRMAHAVPEVDLVGKVGPERVRRQVEPVRQGHVAQLAVEQFAQPQVGELGADAAVRRYREAVDAGPGVDGGPVGVCRHDAAGARLLDSRRGHPEIQVGSQRGVDDAVERRVAEGSPPLRRFVRARGGTGREGGGKVERWSGGWFRQVPRRRAGDAEATRCDGGEARAGEPLLEPSM